MANQGGPVPHFTVDKRGLAKILARRGKEFILTELLQNSWDEDGVTRVDVKFGQEAGHATISVEDDAPEGFQNLAHAYTLFAESKKKANPQQRGRFNLGEKLVIALCEDAAIISTKGTITFDTDGRRETRDAKRKSGTIFLGTLRMNKDEADALRALADTVIPPPGIDTIFNGKSLIHRNPVAVIHTALPTEIADEDGYLKRTRRQTDLKLYSVVDGEKAMLYEMGIPVVETGDTYHVDVQQKVPLNSDRDNVTPAYLREVRTAVLNEMARDLTPEQASSKWVAEAMEDKNIEVEAIKTIIETRFGDKVVINDPSDPEGTKIAMSKEYVVIPSRAFSKEAWENVKASGVKPAGQVTPSPKPYSENGRPENVLPKEEWSEDMLRTESFANALAQRLLGHGVNVKIVMEPKLDWIANYGRFFNVPVLTFNYAPLKLGKLWFAGVGSQSQLEVFLHEFAHDKVNDHLSERFGDEIARLGAKLALKVTENIAGDGRSIPKEYL